MTFSAEKVYNAQARSLVFELPLKIARAFRVDRVVRCPGFEAIRTMPVAMESSDATEKRTNQPDRGWSHETPGQVTFVESDTRETWA